MRYTITHDGIIYAGMDADELRKRLGTELADQLMAEADAAVATQADQAARIAELEAELAALQTTTE